MTLVALVIFYFVATNNVLLGKWTEPPDGDPRIPDTTISAAAKGMEFFRNKHYTTFGMDVGGRPVNAYGKYSFIGSNLIKLEIKGFRAVIKSNFVDMPVKSLPFASAIKPKIWRLSEDGQILEEVDYFGDGGSRKFYKEPRR